MDNFLSILNDSAAILDIPAEVLKGMSANSFIISFPTRNPFYGCLSHSCGAAAFPGREHPFAAWPENAESGQSAGRPPGEPRFSSDAHGSIRPFGRGGRLRVQKSRPRDPSFSSLAGDESNFPRRFSPHGSFFLCGHDVPIGKSHPRFRFSGRAGSSAPERERGETRRKKFLPP